MTGGADQVVVMMICDGFEARLTIFKVALVGDASIHQHHESAVHCCVADSGIAAAHNSQQLLNCHVLAILFEKRVGDDVTLFGRLEAFACQILLQALLDDA